MYKLTATEICLSRLLNILQIQQNNNQVILIPLDLWFAVLVNLSKDWSKINGSVWSTHCDFDKGHIMQFWIYKTTNLYILDTTASHIYMHLAVYIPVRSLWLVSEGWWRDLTSARSLRYAGPFAVTAGAVVWDSRPLWPLVAAFGRSEGSSELSAASKLPADCWRAAVACWTVKPISTIVAMFLSVSCCYSAITANKLLACKQNYTMFTLDISIPSTFYHQQEHLQYLLPL